MRRNKKQSGKKEEVKTNKKNRFKVIDYIYVN